MTKITQVRIKQLLSYNYNTGELLWRKARGKYTVSIHAEGKLRSLGYFIHKVDAIIARKMAEYKYGFHINHGNLRPL